MKTQFNLSQIALDLGLMAILFLATGCPYDEYVVEMQPQGEKIQRTLTFRQLDINGNQTNFSDFPADKLEKLKSGYRQYHFETTNKHHVLEDTFTYALPTDIGTAGQYHHFRTTLGTFSTYLERFGGENDVLLRIERRMKATDQAVEFATEWLESELGQEKNFPQLKEFLAGSFRKDLKNLNLYTWLNEGKPDSETPTNTMHNLVARCAHFAIEQGYVPKEDIALMWGGIYDLSDDYWLRLLRSLLAKKLNTLPTQSWEFLKDSKAMEESLKSFMPKSKYYQVFLQRWKKENPDDTEKANPDTALGMLITDALDFRVFETKDTLTIKLSVPTSPLNFNGTWYPDQNMVTWKTNIQAGKPVELPLVCYATWVEPAKDFQKAHFGKLILEGKSLSEYVLWRINLSPVQGGEWDKFISGLTPDTNLEKCLEAFKIKVSEDESDAFRLGISLITTSLSAPKQ